MGQFVRINRQSALSRMEDIAETIVKKTRRFLPHVGRLCLVSTFIEDGYRLITQWQEQVEFITSLWGIHKLFIMAFVFANIVLQLGGSAAIICRWRVKLGCGMLMTTVLLQTVGYGITNRNFLMRNMALIGSLLLLLAESNEKMTSSLAGLPSTGLDKPKQYMLLGGRVLVVLMFLTLIHWNEGFFYIITTLANLILIIFVTVGYKTKLSALLLVIALTIMNFWYNNFWYYIDRDLIWDFLKYDFFQTWSVIGGLMLITAYGPGGVSFDDYKKDW